MTVSREMITLVIIGIINRVPEHQDGGEAAVELKDGEASRRAEEGGAKGGISSIRSSLCRVPWK